MKLLANVPDYLVKAIRRPPPQDAAVIPGTTPVVHFGDPATARYATLGINPSRREFLDKTGQFLPDKGRRLATLASIGAQHGEELSDLQVRQIAEGCRDYFDRNPYNTWFGHLDKVLKAALSV